MASLNKVELIGNLGADPDIKHLPDGGQIANLRLATSERWRDKTTGEPVERTEWHRVSLFGKLAEIAGQYLAKGSKVYVEGQLRTRKWQAQDGTDRYSTEVVLSGFAGRLIMLDPRPANADTSAAATVAPRGSHAPKHPSQTQAAAHIAAQTPTAADFDDDIPFD